MLYFLYLVYLLWTCVDNHLQQMQCLSLIISAIWEIISSSNFFASFFLSPVFFLLSFFTRCQLIMCMKNLSAIKWWSKRQYDGDLANTRRKVGEKKREQLNLEAKKFSWNCYWLTCLYLSRTFLWQFLRELKDESEVTMPNYK